MELVAGIILGGLLFGGSGSHPIQPLNQPVPRRGMPQFIAYDKKKKQALFFCGNCFGQGTQEQHGGSICAYVGNHSYCYSTCYVCSGKGKIIVDVDDKLWLKAKELTKKK